MSMIHWKAGIFGAVDAAAGWTGDGGPATIADAIQSDAASEAGAAMAKGAKLNTLVGFTGPDGADPVGGVIADAAGDLFGTTYAGGASGDGTVFEIATTPHGYAKQPTTLAAFTGADGQNSRSGLTTDAAGDLFGTAERGGPDGDGTVFEIAKTKNGYAGSPTILASFTGVDGMMPEGSVIADAAGDLFGTTGYGGVDDDGTVFEIAKTKGGYAGAPTIVVSFTGADGQNPFNNLIADAAGDLFGTTFDGGNGAGTVFEIAKTKSGYADMPTTLVNFTGADGFNLYGALIVNAAGDLFGTTYAGGANGYGTVFEIAKTKSGYADTPTTLVNFAGRDGANPNGTLIADAAGDLFGTTHLGGPDGDGTVFEIAKTKQGYAAATTLITFTGANGANPSGALTADAAGDLFGSTEGGGPDDDGTAFEITHSGFAPQAGPVTNAGADSPTPAPSGAAFVQAMASHGLGRFAAGAPVTLTSRDDMRMVLSGPHVA